MTQTQPINRVALLLLIVLVLVALGGAFLAPLTETVPIHWNAAGQPDNFASFWVALLIPLVGGLFVVGLLWWGASRWFAKQYEAGRHVIDAGLAFTLALLIGLEIAFILIGRGVEVNMMRIAALGIGAVFVGIGNVLPKSKPNWISGLRIPTTLSSEKNWRITHRWTGYLMMLSGLLLVSVAAIGLPTAWLVGAVLVAALVPALAGIGISLAVAAREN